MVTPAVVIARPPASVAPIALVCDSPHSGTHYPADFRHSVDRAALRRSEDTFIDELWSQVPAAGGTLVCATFPRSYIDPNRDEADIDPAQVDGPWPGVARPSHQCLALGNGLVWMRTPEHLSIYDRPLPATSIAQRIEDCWRPYRRELQGALDACDRAWGGWWHLNLHSMPSNAYERLGLAVRKPLADVVLGDRHGTTCAAEFTQVLRAAFEGQGLSVAINDPYAGLELVRLAGQPARGRHSLQVEVNRALYLDERTRERGPGFDALRRAIDGVVRDIASFVLDAGHAGEKSSTRSSAAGV